MIGWMYHWGKEAPEHCPFAGALSIPRELRLVEDQVYDFPVEEAQNLLRRESRFVHQDGETLMLRDRGGNSVTRVIQGLNTLDILEDTKSLEVFVNRGEMSFSWWLDCPSRNTSHLLYSPKG